PRHEGLVGVAGNGPKLLIEAHRLARRQILARFGRESVAGPGFELDDRLGIVGQARDALLMPLCKVVAFPGVVRGCFERALAPQRRLPGHRPRICSHARTPLAPWPDGGARSNRTSRSPVSAASSTPRAHGSAQPNNSESPNSSPRRYGCPA